MWRSSWTATTDGRRRATFPERQVTRAGARNIRPIAERCADLGVRYLTIFALSTENLDRPKREVDLLLQLMRRFLEDNIDELRERGVRLRIIGERSRFAAELQMLMKRAEQITRDNDQLHLTIAVNYGGRWDITQAMRGLAKAVAAGQIDPDKVDEHTCRQPAVARQSAAAGSMHPHRRRSAHQQLPAVGPRVQRALFHRRVLAGVRRSPSGTTRSNRSVSVSADSDAVRERFMSRDRACRAGRNAC